MNSPYKINIRSLCMYRYLVIQNMYHPFLVDHNHLSLSCFNFKISQNHAVYVNLSFGILPTSLIAYHEIAEILLNLVFNRLLLKYILVQYVAVKPFYQYTVYILIFLVPYLIYNMQTYILLQSVKIGNFPY